MKYRSAFFTAAAVCLTLCPQPASGQFGGGEGSVDDSTYTFTSMLVVGDISQAPLDQASLNALFTHSFANDVAIELKKTVGEDVKYELTPTVIQFVYTGDSKKGDSHVAQITVAFDDPPEELLPLLRLEAPTVALKLMKDRVFTYLNSRHDLRMVNFERQRVQLKDRRANLQAKLNQHQNELLSLEQDTLSIESADDVRSHFLALKKKQREDRLAELDAAARRDAIEKQLEQLQDEANESNDEDSEKVQLMKQALKIRAEETADPRFEQALQEVEGNIARQKKLMADYEKQLANSDSDSKGKQLEMLNDKLRTLQAERNHFRQMIRSSQKRVETKAIEARIAYLKAVEERRQSKYGPRIEKLNNMLTEVAVYGDEAEARRKTLEKEIDAAASAVYSKKNSEVEMKSRRRQIELLEHQLEIIERKLFEVEMQLEQPAVQEFSIMPWGG